MPALLSEVFKETSFTVDDGQIKAHYGKPAPAPTATAKTENSEKEQWEERIVALIKQNNELQEQIKAMQQKMETTIQQGGGARFDIMAFAEQNPVITIIIILVGIDLFRKAFLK